MATRSISVVFLTSSLLALCMASGRFLDFDFNATLTIQAFLTMCLKLAWAFWLAPVTIPNKGKRSLFFAVWYGGSLSLNLLLCHWWPNLFVFCLLLQQILVFHGIQGLLWKGNPQEIRRVLPLPFYAWLVLGTLLLASLNHFILREHLTMTLSQGIQFLLLTWVLVLPLWLHGCLLAWLIERTRRTRFYWTQQTKGGN